MTDPLHLLRALAEAVARSGPVTGPAGRPPAAERVCRAVADLLGADGAALTCAPADPTRYTACATDEVAARLAEVEDLVGDGPAVRAVRHGRSVGTVLGPGAPGRSADLPPDVPEVPPVFAVLAGEVLDPGATVAVRSWPVRDGGQVIAALTVHGPVGCATPEAQADGQVLADALAPAVVGPAVSGVRARGRRHRAVGMLVAQTGLAPEDAAALLRARAWAEDVAVADLEDAVLARRATFSGGDTAGPLPA
ncbi:hypothetical protein [Cellulomonas pakistanensis]|uniref:hypothetical protein n=1 Tax=Cellulomonas pakistanensis TaxID=992287 RepID=UPI001944E91B|nr:hypothetical protein [Cellulomonas pakistanensis]